MGAATVPATGRDPPGGGPPVPSVLYSFPHRLGVTGIGMTAWHQVAGLAANGVEATVFCGSCERPLPDGVRVVQTLRRGRVRVPYRALGVDRTVAAHDAITAAALRTRLRGTEVVHCWPLGARRTLEAARRLGTTSVLERPNAHTAFAYDAVARVCATLGLPIEAAGTHAFSASRLAHEEREYGLAGRLLCPSDFVAGTFEAAGVAPGRLLRHHYGYDPAVFHAHGRDDSGRRPFTIAFVGRGEPRKGLHVALEAWIEAGAPGRFIVAGVVDESYARLLEGHLAHPRVERLGPVADPARVMRGADVLVLPSFEEGSALVTYEARACGCVLAVSDRAGAACRPDVDALVHRAGDTGRLQVHLAELAADPERRSRLRRASLEGARGLTWTDAGRVLAGAYATARAGRNC